MQSPGRFRFFGFHRHCVIHSKLLMIFHLYLSYIFDNWWLFFVLKCNYLPSNLPIILSKFHQQCLLAWKISYIHNFSPHKAFIWNNVDTTIKNKSIFFSRWYDNGIYNVIALFDRSGAIFNYKQFLSCHNLPVRFGHSLKLSQRG